MDEQVGRDGRRDALRGQLDEMKRLQREEQRERREALKRQLDEMKRLQKDEQQERQKVIEAQIEELKRLHREQQESQQALLRQINELRRLDREEQRERKKGLREQLGERVEQARREHELQHIARSPEFQFLGGDPEQRKGLLRMYVLIALSFRPAHGYELMHWIGHHSGLAWTPSPGSMYPALDSLEMKGYIACRGDGRRKVYALTAKGQQALARLQKKREEQFYEMKAFLLELFDEETADKNA